MDIWSIAIGDASMGPGTSIPSSTQRRENFSDNTPQPYLNFFLHVDVFRIKIKLFPIRTAPHAGGVITDCNVRAAKPLLLAVKLPLSNFQMRGQGETVKNL
jgi:hypothetical protein